MRISDWSSDVCSSDLRAIRRVALHIDALDAAAIDEIVDVASAPRRRQRGVDVALVQPEHRELLLIDVDMDGRHIGKIAWRSEEHTSELQSLMRISYAVFCLKKKKYTRTYKIHH